jgi:hypothetical protein
MTDDLVKQLRLPWPKDGSGDEVTLPLWVLILTAEAADRIEALIKERDEAMQLLQTLSNMNGDLSRDMYKTKLLLAKAVEALRFGVDLIEGDSIGHEWKKGQADFRRMARATIAEIEGEKT